MDLPAPIAAATASLFDAFPLATAMGRLVPKQGTDQAMIDLVESILSRTELVDYPALGSALWLYVDELDRSHVISQGIDDVTGSFWHGIMHRREGDFSNSHYWFRKVGTHTAMAQMPGYDPHQFIDDVEAAGRDDESLVALQRQEWQVLFAWCAQEAVGEAGAAS